MITNTVFEFGSEIQGFRYPNVERQPPGGYEEQRNNSF
jgi:hypothetical protein